jgi:uncharacterized repeat protein (TIGR01451 family)
VDPATSTVYVVNRRSNSVSVIDGATNTVTATVTVGLFPDGVGVDPATNTVYVADFDNCAALAPAPCSVSVIDGATTTVTHAVYVANFGSRNVSVATPLTDPDLSLSDTAPASVISGGSYSYTLTATNTGGQDATSVAVTDTLPASVHFDSASVTAGSGPCARTSSGPPMTRGGTVTCTADSLAGGASVTITITVTATTPGTVSDSASATATNVTADADDSGSAPTVVIGT